MALSSANFVCINCAHMWNFNCRVIIMPRCACASEVYGSVFVCVVSVSLCRLLEQLLKDQ